MPPYGTNMLTTAAKIVILTVDNVPVCKDDTAVGGDYFLGNWGFISLYEIPSKKQDTEAYYEEEKQYGSYPWANHVHLLKEFINRIIVNELLEFTHNGFPLVVQLA